MSKTVYAAVQNGVILSVFDTKEEARARVDDEIKKDWLSIMLKRKLRKLLKKTGNVALHTYSVITISEVLEVK